MFLSTVKKADENAEELKHILEEVGYSPRYDKDSLVDKKYPLFCFYLDPFYLSCLYIIQLNKVMFIHLNSQPVI